MCYSWQLSLVTWFFLCAVLLHREQIHFTILSKYIAFDNVKILTFIAYFINVRDLSFQIRKKGRGKVVLDACKYGGISCVSFCNLFMGADFK
jgi:hypothetical protein